tara:strand:- start:39 stop:185 length:147 start_codon:yes stop_codon:yes gene_type:complete
MVPGVPGDVYCENDECFNLNLVEAFRARRERFKSREYEKYLELKEKFE